MINKVILVGTLGKDPELKYTPSGVAVANFSIATSEKWTKDGEKKEQTEWHNIVIWRKLAEICSQYLVKGSQVYLGGKIQTRSYDDSDGNKKYITEIVCHEMKMLGGKKADGNQGQENNRGGGGQQVDPDDEIPF